MVDVRCGGCPVWWMSGVVDVRCGGCLVWWMSGVVDVRCGGCPILHMVWWMSGVVDVWCGGCPILHMVWWMSGVVDVWCGGCLCGGCRTILSLIFFLVFNFCFSSHLQFSHKQCSDLPFILLLFLLALQILIGFNVIRVRVHLLC